MILLTSALFYFEEAKPQSGNIYTLVMMAGFFFIMYFVLLRPQIKQQKEQKKMIDALKAGDKIITSGGIWGDVDMVEANRVRLKLNDKTKIMVSRSAIGGLQPTKKDDPPSGGSKK